MMIGKLWRSVGTVGKCGGRYDGVRTMVGKASNRAGVHGSRVPDSKVLENEEEMRERINKGKEEKEEKRREVEKKVEASSQKGTSDDDDDDDYSSAR